MEGNLRETSLESVLELIHFTAQSGSLEVDAQIPLTLHLERGEIHAGGILDWTEADAVRSFRLLDDAGTFRFIKDAFAPVSATPFRIPFAFFMTEWARTNDEWERLRAAIDSPSRVLEPASVGANAAFAGGRSIRAAARAASKGVFEMALEAARGLQERALRLTPRYAWHGLRVNHSAGRTDRLPASRTLADLPPYLDGKRNLGDLIAVGFKPEVLRIWLVNALRSGEVEVPGRGWLLRDLTWEFEKEHS